jgi:hypothetical protein
MTFKSRFGNLVVEDEPVYKSELYDNPSINLNSIITSSVEWSRNILPPVGLNDGEIANGFTFFDAIHTYTADASDPFVTGGFYIALINNTGQTLGFLGNAGILIQSIFEKPVNFTP